MDVSTLLKTLEAERDALDATIKTLRGRLGASKPQGVPKAQPKRHGRVWSAADKLRMSKLIKARLAAKKKLHKP